MMTCATDASEVEVAFSQFGIGVARRLKSGKTLIWQGKVMRIWGQVPGTCWELSIWCVRRERGGRTHTGEGKIWKNRESWTDQSGPLCFKLQLQMTYPEASSPSIPGDEFTNLGIMGSELRAPPPPILLIGLEMALKRMHFKNAL